MRELKATSGEGGNQNEYDKQQEEMGSNREICK
jgi:hypothetical protein